MPHRQLRQEGSQVASHAMVQALVVIVVLALLQLAFALHTRNLAISAAGEGARRAAVVGGDASEAIWRTSELIDDSLGPSRPRDIEVSSQVVAGRETIVVTVRTSMPVLLAWGPSGSLVVRGRSVAEVDNDP